MSDGGGEAAWLNAPPPRPGAMAPPARRLRPLTLADVLDGMFRLLLANWRAYVIPLALVLVPINFVVGYLSVSVGGGAGMLEQLNDPATAQAVFQAGPELRTFIALMAASVLAALFATPFVNGVACRAAAEGFEGRNPTAAEVTSVAGRRYGTLILVTLALIGVVLLCLGAPLGLMILGGVNGQGGLVGFGALLLVVALVPMVWLMVSFSLAYAVVVVEKVGAVAALRRSSRLVRGRFWRVLGTLALAAIIAGIVSRTVALPFSLPGSLFSDTVAVVFTSIGAAVAAIITTPLSGNAQTLLYFDGRIRSEAYDLVRMVDDIDQPAPSDPPVD